MRNTSETLPIFMGAAAARVLAEADFFHGFGLSRPLAGSYRDRAPFRVGPFRVTPYLVDHSAYDAYALLVETRDRRLLYTGDLRAHGRKPGTFERLVADPPRDLDVLLMEGTQVHALNDNRAASPPGGEPTETDVEHACTATFRAAPGLVLALYSAQNIDRLVSLYRAALRADRDFVMDLYTASIAAATGNPRIPQPGWDRVRVYLPADQRARVIEAAQLHRTDAVRPWRIYRDELDARADQLVLTVRGAMLRELADAPCLDHARAVWSMWPGYLTDDSTARLRALLADRHIPLLFHHCSGHAYLRDLQRLVTALAPRRVVPMHTAGASAFPCHFPRVTPVNDGQRWEV